MKNRIWFKLFLSIFLLLTFLVVGTAHADTPTLSTVTIASNNASTTLAKVGDVITITFVSSEALGVATSTINGFEATVASTSATAFTATYTLTSGSSDGAITFKIGFVNLTDEQGVEVSAVTAGPGVIFDKTAPTVVDDWTMNMNAGTMTINFSEDMAISANVDETKITIQEAIDSTAVGTYYTLTNSVATWTSSTTLSIALSATDLNALKADVGLADSSITSFLQIASGSLITDFTGNALSLTNVTDGACIDAGTFTADTTAPTITPITITSSNASTTLAKVGDVITITFTSSEALGVATSTIAGHSATVASTTATAFTATYTMVTGDTEGAIAFKIGTVDMVGKYSSEASAVTTGADVVFDKTAPTNQDTVYATSGLVLDGATVTIVSSGNTYNNIWIAPSGTTSFVANATTKTKATNGVSTSIIAPTTTGSYKVFVLDAAGNSSAESTATLVVDATHPTITLLGTTPVSLVYREAYTDAGASASDNVDGTITSSIVTVNPVDTSTPGTYTITYNVSDTAGNAATQVTRTVVVSVADSGGVVSGGSGGGSYTTPFTYRPVATTISAPTTANEIMAQIQTLLAQIKSLQTQAGLPSQPTSYAVSGASKINAGLKLGYRNGNVTALQKILAQDREIYPSGLVTGFFGSMTQKAVQAFQIKYGVVSSASDAGYGYVGPKTRAKLIEVFGK